MNTSLLSAALPSIARATSTAISQERTTMTTNDPSLWLEDIEGQDALAWARAENEKTLGVLQSDPRYRRFYEQALSILQAKDRIAYVSLGRRGLENFWQDENHVRGIWRRTTLESYCSQDPQWETILDVDALAVAENRNWVFQGASCLPPKNASA
ncbi:hypothetical protein [Bradyrhizobium elkanii]|uniref:hypothetical protein n=1 Tax=Bradyrhizobium elkanii TaxID=29448 RepID=UPI0027144D3D|nr:hypothetical protein [Bradyrhizobium elkanii]WLB83079.1 hypothetical protein QIH83_11200 [Bradyrhizobium elkanii]